MPTEIREVLMDRAELAELMSRCHPGDALRLCNIPAGARLLQMGTYGRAARDDRVRLCLYEIDVPGPDSEYRIGLSDVSSSPPDT